GMADVLDFGLAGLTSIDVAALLREAASDPDPTIRRRVGEDLTRVRTAPARELLRELVSDEDADVRESVAAHGFQLGDDAIELLRITASDPEPPVRLATVGVTGPRLSVQPL